MCVKQTAFNDEYFRIKFLYSCFLYFYIIQIMKKIEQKQIYIIVRWDIPKKNFLEDSKPAYNSYNIK